MSTSAVTVYVPGELAQQEFGDRFGIIREVICPTATDAELDLFAMYVQRTELDPFARQVYAVKRMKWNPQKGQMEPGPISIQTGIDGFRLIAQRTGEYAGQLGPFWFDASTREWLDVWLDAEPPAAAKVGVWRKGFVEPLWGVARFDSYAARDNKNNLINLWKKMPEVMIGKCAEALALRRAFPQQLSGIYTDDEMMQAGPPVTATPSPTALPAGVHLQEDAKPPPLPPGVHCRDHGPARISGTVHDTPPQHRADSEKLHATVSDAPERFDKEGAAVIEPESVREDEPLPAVVMIQPDTKRALWATIRGTGWKDEEVRKALASRYPEAKDTAGKPSTTGLTEPEAIDFINFIKNGGDGPPAKLDPA